MKRVEFNPQADTAVAESPRIASRRCYANGCPMVGCVTDHGGDHARWLCGDHYGTEPDKWPRITETMHRHRVLCDAINEGQALNNRGWSDVTKHHACQWQRAALLDSLSYEIRPAKFPRADTLAEWLTRCRDVLSSKVREESPL